MQTSLPEEASAAPSAFRLPARSLIVAMLGIGLDVWLLSNRGAALANEEIFAFTNPGHVLFGAGLLLTADGVVLGLIGPEMLRPLPSRLIAGVLVIVTGAVLAFGFATPSEHSHEDEHASSSDEQDDEALTAKSRPLPL